MRVAVAVGVGVGVGVLVFVASNVGVAEEVAVGVLVGVEEGVRTGVTVRVGLGETVGVGVGVDVASLGVDTAEGCASGGGMGFSPGACDGASSCACTSTPNRHVIPEPESLRSRLARKVGELATVPMSI